ncbi:MAG: hypothetical protein K0B02_01030 [DPANN group archaeon]|nr:hypothetical protein [DPANN group archaeon]
MAKHKKKSESSNGKFTLIVIAIFILSTVGSIMLSSPANTGTEIAYPESAVIDRQFTQGEFTAIRQSGLVAIIFSSDICIENCDLMLMDLERTVQKYSPYVFMSRTYNASAPITLISYSAIEEFETFNQTVIDEVICQSLYIDPAEKSKYCLPLAFKQ